MPTVQRLLPADADAYVALRREMLLDTPEAFLASPEFDRGSDPDKVRDSLGRAEVRMFGAFEAERLVAVAGIERQALAKRRHVAVIWSVYVTPAARGQGLGRAVVAACIEAAREWPGVEVLELAVSENTPRARQIYESLGFKVWGVEPDAVRSGGRSFAEYHLQRRL